MSKKILGLLPTFTSANYGNLDKQQLEAYVKKFKMPEIGTRESVSGFVPSNPIREDELISKGGQIGTLITFCVSTHTYDRIQVKREVDKKVASWSKRNGEEEKSKSEIKKKQDEVTKEVKREFREQGKTKISNKETPILISSKNKIFIGLGPRDKSLEQICGLLPSAGFSEVRIDSYNETVELSVLTQVLNDLNVLDGIQVEDPFSPDEFLSLSIGEECKLVSTGDENKERAKFEAFDLENRDEVIQHIENGKQAAALQFSFRIDDHHIAFTYNVGGGYTGTKRVIPDGSKPEALEQNQAIILSSYALVSANKIIQKLTEL